MNDSTRTCTVPDDQVSLALSRVHGRLRRRRNTFRGAGAAALACVAVLGMGFAIQPEGRRADTSFGVDAMESDGSPAGASVPEQGGFCGHALAPAEVFGLELVIDGPVEWPALDVPFGPPTQVVVIARNAGSRPLTISIPLGVVGLGDDSFVATELAPPAVMPATVTLEPSEEVEFAAGLPSRSCSGDSLDSGTYSVVPVVVVDDTGGRPVAVRGSARNVEHR